MRPSCRPQWGCHTGGPGNRLFRIGSALGVDVIVEPHVIIGPNVWVGDGAVIRSFSHLEDCRVGMGATVGPFARIRPGTELGEGAKVGNFVEISASAIGRQSKVSHLPMLAIPRSATKRTSVPEQSPATMMVSRSTGQSSAMKHSSDPIQLSSPPWRFRTGR